MLTSTFHGSIVAIVTPFRAGAVDDAALRDLVLWHKDEGTHGVVAAGTTGETPTLSEDERRRVVEIAIEASAGHIPVIAGVGGPNTQACIEKTRHAKAEGAHAGLVVTPYYNRPSQEGLYAHYSAIADAVALPLIVYNVPNRTGVDLSVETLGRLASHPNIIGVKDATAEMKRVPATASACGADFVQLSGDDSSALGFMAMGGHGSISVTANAAPGLSAQMHEAALQGRFAQARALNDRLAPLHEAGFADASPGPIKHALSLLGKCAPELRLPMTPPSAQAQARVAEALTLASQPVETA